MIWFSLWVWGWMEITIFFWSYIIIFFKNKKIWRYINKTCVISKNTNKKYVAIIDTGKSNNTNIVDWINKYSLNVKSQQISHRQAIEWLLDIIVRWQFWLLQESPPPIKTFALNFQLLLLQNNYASRWTRKTSLFRRNVNKMVIVWRLRSFLFMRWKNIFMFLYECVYSISFYGAVAEQNKLKSPVLEKKRKRELS